MTPLKGSDKDDEKENRSLTPIPVDISSPEPCQEIPFDSYIQLLQATDKMYSAEFKDSGAGEELSLKEMGLELQREEQEIVPKIKINNDSLTNQLDSLGLELQKAQERTRDLISGQESKIKALELEIARLTRVNELLLKEVPSGQQSRLKPLASPFTPGLRKRKTIDEAARTAMMTPAPRDRAETDPSFLSPESS